ncbi:MAG: M20/M25/M40 family metallo-hydrolase [Janthinobacterium lividum]
MMDALGKGSLYHALLTGAFGLACACANALPPETAAHDHDARQLRSSAAFQSMKEALARDYGRIVADIVALTQIPAPPFQEAARAKAFADMLKATGLEDVTIDAEGNAYGVRRGTGEAPAVVIVAHLDTVFPEGTDVTVKRDGNTLRAPGIADDTCSLAVLLAFKRAMDAARVRTRSDIIFMGSVGEEGEGNLRGMRYLFTKSPLKDKIGCLIAFEPGATGRIFNAGVGSKRYRITFKGPGGHSSADFGMVNPAYALGNAITAIGKITVPVQPRTTYNVGIIDGGTSVNSIPHAAMMEIDLRSREQESLAKVEKAILAIPRVAADEENRRGSNIKGGITYDIRLIGDRPMGRVANSADIVLAAAAAIRAADIEPKLVMGSTDANLPMSLGIAAIALESGLTGVRSHSLEESLTLDSDKDLGYMSIALATVLRVAGWHHEPPMGSEPTVDQKAIGVQ